MAEQSGNVATMTDAELDALIARDEQARAVSQKERERVVARTKKRNRLKLGEIERALGKVLGVDLAVIWCPDGQMAVVQKPSQLAYERYQLRAMSSDTLSAAELDVYASAPTIVYPPADQLQAFWDQWASAKLACAAAATALMSCSQEDFRAK